jgi:hypothetical protein
MGRQAELLDHHDRVLYRVVQQGTYGIVAHENLALHDPGPCAVKFSMAQPVTVHAEKAFERRFPVENFDILIGHDEARSRMVL